MIPTKNITINRYAIPCFFASMQNPKQKDKEGWVVGEYVYNDPLEKDVNMAVIYSKNDIIGGNIITRIVLRTSPRIGVKDYLINGQPIDITKIGGEKFIKKSIEKDLICKVA